MHDQDCLLIKSLLVLSQRSPGKLRPDLERELSKSNAKTEYLWVPSMNARSVARVGVEMRFGVEISNPPKLIIKLMKSGVSEL